MLFSLFYGLGLGWVNVSTE